MGVGGRKFVGAGRKVRCGERVRMGVGGRKFVGAGTKVRCGEGHGGSRSQARVRSRGAKGCKRAWAGSLYSGVLLPLHQVAISGKERI